MRVQWLVVAFAVSSALAACDPPPPASAPVATEQARSAESGGQAKDPIASAVAELRAAAGQRRIMVIGEMHGTREIPALAVSLLDAYAREGPVRLGLELPSAQQVAIDAWISGGDREAARAAMMAADTGWSRPPQENDGRRNAEILGLLDRVRAAKADGADIEVLAFDVPGAPGDAAARDERMALRLREAYATDPAARWIVVTGNVHAMKFKPDACPQCQKPMTAYLSDLPLFSVNVHARKGAFHACPTDRPCGPTAVAGGIGSSGPVTDTRTPFDYLLVLPEFTPAELP